jgi:hypothetical protein
VPHAALICTVVCLAAAPGPGTYGGRLGAHSMIYLNSTPAEQEAAFAATAAAGLRYLRMEFAVGQIFPYGGEDFSAVDRVNALAGRYGVEVLGVVTTTPWYIAACPGGATEHLDRCAPAPAWEGTWRDMVARLAQRASNVRFWELGNEPDIGYGFTGPPADYARWAGTAADGIRVVRPDARIAIGGFARLDASYIDGSLHDAAHPLIDRINIANIHLRGSLRGVRSALRRAKALYRDAGFKGALWVTETGYPSRREHQMQLGYQDGPRAQARWVSRALRTLVDGGAGAVFVSLRDNHEFGATSPFMSEGILRWPSARPKPAFRAVQRLAAAPRSR